MDIVYAFSSVSDWGSPEHGDRLVNTLESSGLHIAKADEAQPVRKVFDRTLLPTLWRGTGIQGGTETCNFLFRGTKAHRFYGFVTWHRRMVAHRTSFNWLYVTLSAAHRPSSAFLVELGDALFQWSRAAHGVIAPVKKGEDTKIGYPISMRLPGLFWVNYFGPPYAEDPDFCLGPAAVKMEAGFRLQLTGEFDDPVLQSTEYVASQKHSVGYRWFVNHVPRFDFSELRG